MCKEQSISYSTSGTSNTPSVTVSEGSRGIQSMHSDWSSGFLFREDEAVCLLTSRPRKMFTTSASRLRSALPALDCVMPSPPGRRGASWSPGLGKTESPPPTLPVCGPRPLVPPASTAVTLATLVLWASGETSLQQPLAPEWSSGTENHPYRLPSAGHLPSQRPGSRLREPLAPGSLPPSLGPGNGTLVLLLPLNCPSSRLPCHSQLFVVNACCLQMAGNALCLRVDPSE